MNTMIIHADDYARAFKGMSSVDRDTSLIQQVNNALITFVLEEARNGRYHRCLALGFSHELIGRLQQLPSIELHKLLSSPHLWIKPVVDVQTLERILKKIEVDEEREQLIHRTLKLGATAPMMLHFFGITHGEIATRRKMLDIPASRGRIPGLSDPQRHAVWERWVKLVQQHEQETGIIGISGNASISNTKSGSNLDEQGQLDLMLMIAEEQDIPVALIWQELTEVLQGESR